MRYLVPSQSTLIHEPANRTTMSNIVQSLPNDVSRCRGIACKLKNECRRFLSYRHDFNSGTWFSTTNFTPNVDGSCNHQIARVSNDV